MALDRRLIWEDPDNLPGEVSEYRIKYGTAQGGPYPTVITCPIADGSSKTINLAPGMYYFVATAANIDGESPNSNEVSMKVYNTPVRVLNLSIEVLN